MSVGQGLVSARQDLDSAKRFQHRMIHAEFITDYEDFWKALLFCLTKVWQKTKGACCSHPRYGPWVGPWIKDRSGNKLLTYLAQARDADGHTVSPITQAVPGQLTIMAGAEPVYIRGIAIGPSGLEVRHNGANRN
jgi:hypothetical protein